ncbi:Uncharacterized protein HI_1162 [Geodia barretti]|nr:Uncharacterized protein HI_1162 [Geodia barretti]
MRNDPTDAEHTLWQHLRTRRLDGHRFVRQYVIETAIVDFACPSHKLAIELDGGQHDQRRTQDQLRTQRLNQHGYRVIRFWNNEVINNIEGVLQTIQQSRAKQQPTNDAADFGHAIRLLDQSETGASEQAKRAVVCPRRRDMVAPQPSRQASSRLRTRTPIRNHRREATAAVSRRKQRFSGRNVLPVRGRGNGETRANCARIHHRRGLRKCTFAKRKGREQASDASGVCTGWGRDVARSRRQLPSPPPHSNANSKSSAKPPATVIPVKASASADGTSI